MNTARLIRIVLAGLAGMPAGSALAFLEEYEVDFGQISEAGQEIIDRFAPQSFKDQYRFYTPEEVAATFTSMQTSLTGGSLEALAAARPDARQLLVSLRANPNTQDYADWLEARMDYFDMAAEVERAIPAPPPSPAPRPAPQLPPHPSMPQPVLVPHPAEPEKPALPPHPTAPQPVLIPHPATPPPPLIPHPAEPKPPPAPAPKPADPRPAVTQARNRYVENRQVWVRKLGNRPPPARAAALLPDLKRIFREEGVPPEFVWQAEAESTFNPAARSPAGAVGLYQFMPATAQQFGLRLSPQDERLDALKNARAAAKYLKLLHGRFGNWPLAFAAYNCGQGRVAGALRASGGATFDDIHDRLPAETRMYVPKIAALVQLRENADMDRL
jgi:membrane-bound lytic murein transglycosylase D